MLYEIVTDREHSLGGWWQQQYHKNTQSFFDFPAFHIFFTAFIIRCSVHKATVDII